MYRIKTQGQDGALSGRSPHPRPVILPVLCILSILSILYILYAARPSTSSMRATLISGPRS